jgi:hypothetical protein
VSFTCPSASDHTPRICHQSSELCYCLGSVRCKRGEKRGRKWMSGYHHHFIWPVVFLFHAPWSRGEASFGWIYEHTLCTQSVSICLWPKAGNSRKKVTKCPRTWWKFEFCTFFQSICCHLLFKFLNAILFFLIIHIFICAYIVWVISSPCLPTTSLSPHSPHFHAELVLLFSPILLKSRHKQ